MTKKRPVLTIIAYVMVGIAIAAVVTYKYGNGTQLIERFF